MLLAMTVLALARLAMTILALARLAMTSQIAVIARPKAAAIHEVRGHGLPRR
jgi:hypothetical protein